MARGGKRKGGRGGKRDNIKHAKRSKFKLSKKKTPSFRDIKHSSQYKEQPSQLPRKKYIREEDEEVEPPRLDPLQQLMSTFTSNYSETAINSDDSSEDDSEMSKGSLEVLDSITERDENSDAKAGSDVDETLADEEEMEADEADTVCDMSDNESITNEETEGEINNAADPFHMHLNYDLHESVLDSINASPQNVTKYSLYWPKMHNLKVEIPKKVLGNSEESTSVIIRDENEFAKEYSAPEPINTVNLSSLHIKSQIHKRIPKANNMDFENNDVLTPLQMELFSIMNNYQDLFYSERSFINADEVMFTYCLHVVNHVLKTRLKVVHHNERLLKKDKNQVPDDFRDQGLVRPKVLILVPFRESCLRIVNMLAAILLDNRGNLVNKARFLEEFSGSELAMPKKNPKPEDYELLFKGNVDDTFRIGLNFTKKSLKLYSEFYASDVIIASPLGLRMVVGAEGDKERDFDFLASIELLVLDQCDLFLMQNWDHLVHVLDHLHIQPRESHGTDFSRVRSWALNGWAKYYRQTLVFSSIVTAELNALFNRKCLNYAGKVRTANPVEGGTICQVVVQAPQVFHKLVAGSVLDSLEARFQLLVDQILPQFRDPIMTGVLLYVPSYFDYVRIRNYLKREDYNFVQICEYSKDGKVARARDMFYHNEARFLLYSERFHFFRRITLKGIRHIVFYQPPTFPHFYSEMCNLMQEANQNRFLTSDSNCSVTVLYSKYDIHQLSAIVKTSRASRMVSSDKKVHMFTTAS